MTTAQDHRAAGPATPSGEERGGDELRRVHRALRTLSAGNRALLRATNEAALLDDMCRVIVEEGGYRFAGVWHPKADGSSNLVLKSFALHVDHDLREAEHMEMLELSFADIDQGHSAPGIAFRTGDACIGRNLLTDPDHIWWREDSIRYGYGSVSAFPLIVDAGPAGVLSIAAVEPDAFDDAEVGLLRELAEDLAFGIANLRLRVKQKQAEATIQHMAYYDALTGLGNRALFSKRLQEAIAQAKEQHRPLALLLVCLRHFQEINDTLGYQQGDLLLQQFGLRLQEAIGADEVVARVGEAEFAVLLPAADADYATRVARQFEATLYQPVDTSGLKLDARATIGIALFPGHANEPESLLRRARVAMVHARRSGRDYAIFAASLDQESSRRLALMGDLRTAIDHNELQLYCQPEVCLATGCVCATEALARWRHPVHGMVSPTEFVRLAEHAGLIVPLTRWVLEAAFRQRHAWSDAGLEQPISVNLSAHDLRDAQLVDTIAGLAATWGALPSWIQFELTESAVMEDPARALETLGRLKTTGARLLVDDYGTGYSSLSYLQKLPVDAIKIDQFFVSRILENAGSAAIVRSTVDLGHSLDLEVVAEGVESQAVCDSLKELGCDVIQGYFVSMPMPAEEFPSWTTRSSWGT